MNITFLVGNGFDMSLGIDTSYRGFYKWYCAQPSDKECIKAFKKDIDEDIKNGGENWSDFEMGLGKYTNRFTDETAKEFIDCYEDAREKIIEYIVAEAQKFSFADLTETDFYKMRKGLLLFYEELSQAEYSLFQKMFDEDRYHDSVINFISFNYTNILDKWVKRISDKPLKAWHKGSGVRRIRVNPKVMHIHGTANLYPIIGVNDETQISNQELLKGVGVREIMIKPESVKAIREDWYERTKNLIVGSKIICIYGMSLGESDLACWKLITKWLEGAAGRQLIIFWYIKKPVDTRSIYTLVNDKDEIKQKIIRFSGWTQERFNAFSERIHVIFNTKSVLRVLKGSPKLCSLFETWISRKKRAE